MTAIAISIAARVRLRVWPVSGIEVVSPWVLVDQDEAEHSQPGAVVRVRVEAADPEVSDKEAGAGVGGQARRHPAHEHGSEVGGAAERRDLQEPGGQDDGGGEEEGETDRLLVAEPGDQAAGHGRSRARHAWEEGDDLAGA